MATTPDEPRMENLGISRRTLLQRGAVVSGTLMLAGPTIQSLARPAFADNGTPAEGPAISYVAVVLHCEDGTTLRAKWEEGSSHPGGWEPDPGPPNPMIGGDCYPDGYHDAESADGNALGLAFVLDASGSSGTLSVPDTVPFEGGTCDVVTVSAAVWGGPDNCSTVTNADCSAAGGCSIPLAL